MNARKKTLDTTYLSLDQAEARGFLHRDYLAHCLRWSHVVRYLYTGKNYLTARILDVGCGEEFPLLKLLHSSRLGPVNGSYTGLDAKKFKAEFKVNFSAQVLPGTVFPTDELLRQTFSLVVCLEVLEHVEPAQGLTMLRAIQAILKKSKGTAFISTPCYDAKVGAADNHVAELSYQAVQVMLRLAGLRVVAHWGTFASQRDYKPLLTAGQEEVFDKLQAYYDSNILACIFAPLFPQASRNCLWQVEAAEVKVTPAELRLVQGEAHCSSTCWPNFIMGLLR